ncbi:phosphoribosylanthranilate isomerase [Flavobacterium soli]
MKIKICGMKYPENIAEVSKLQPDFLGFIFWEKSPRFFDVEIPKLPDSIQKVGVFVDASLEEIRSKKKQYNLNIIQLHGNETVDFCSNLKQDDILIIKVFSIDDTFDFTALEPFEDVCDYFLFDTKGKMPGGNGTTFNWELLKKYNSKKSLFLSGGIGIEEIIKIKHLNLPIYAIDLNSKFEIEPGLKNIEQLQEILPLKNKKK